MTETKLQSVNGANTPAQTDDSRAITYTPRVDILETEDDLRLMADLPGVKPEDVDIRYENGELSIHGRRQATHTDKNRVYAEAEVTSFYRSFRLAEHIAADKIAAELKNGVLTLTLPKVEAVKPRRIAVRG